ncbi:MAG: glutamyl-tRNA reductase, partial [Gemmatimonadota bacterium]
VEHLYRVVTSLDSMVLGEAQIQGQVKAAYEAAAVVKSDGRSAVGPVLSRLFETALSVGGRVRSATALGQGAASVPSAAVELAKKIFGTLEGRRALVLGAGEMSELALECFAGEGIESVVVANRTAERAETLASRTGGRAIGYEGLAARLPETDIVAAATAAPRPVLTRELVERALPAGAARPLLIVDIALPRDVEPGVGGLDNVFLYDLDDLQQVVEGNLERRREEVPAAESLIEEAVERFEAWHAARDVAPLIEEMRGRAEAVRREEVERALGKLRGLGSAEREAVETLTRRLLNKVLHRPTVRLREAASNGSGEDVVEAAKYLFALGSQNTTDEDEA